MPTSTPAAGATGTAVTSRAVHADLFGKVSAGRISETIVSQVRALMRQGQLRPGDRLPAERDLCEQFGVSRVTVREALRMLESSGLVQIRVGAHGGAFVTVPGSGRVGDGLTDMLSLAVISAADVTELRRVLEIGIVPLLCERATEEDLADLDRICARAREALAAGSYTMEMSADFHERVARAAHNPALTMLAESFRGPVLMSLQEARATAPEMGELGTAEHERFVAAVRSRDAATAMRVMRDHLDRTAHRVGGA